MKKLPIFDDPDNLKRYYSIGEVAELFEVTKSLIRFWEGEFDFLKPHKNSKGERRFTPQNLEQLQLIYELVKERGFTIDGARQEIKRHLKWEEEKAEALKRLKRVRKGLKELLNTLPEA
ncbi:MAG: MerR family transcriptional regulator [Phaeodactylibacter sp.]|uniref:MerR family transcriptional regulator n=1 Tax=Phaeodactylibacter sp. TaxID=1940289 RepID=UPI0032F03E06